MVGGVEISLAASSGVAWSADHDKPESVIGAADEAMYGSRTTSAEPSDV